LSTIDSLAKDFLDQKKIAVVGVRHNRDDAANAAYRKLRSAGHQVFAVNPKTETIDGDRCYPDLKSLPMPVDGVVIFTKPSITEQVVHQCIELRIPRVWMHCMFGTNPRFGKKMSASITSASPEAIRLCKENNIAVISGGCPMMFCEPVDTGHKCMRGIFRLLGNFAS
jgi:predicted CoA-binding protein